jgi:hypothetical protein
VIVPSQVQPATLPAAPAAPADVPAIEVHIGRIDIVPPPPPPPAGRPRRRERRGFGDLALARRHLDRRWY